MQATQDRVLKVLAEQITGSVDIDYVTIIKPTHHLYQDLRCDSLELVEMTIGLEEEFGIKLEDDDMLKLTTVQQVIDHIAGVCTTQQVAA
jgi:acyl carrier protein